VVILRRDPQEFCNTFKIFGLIVLIKQNNSIMTTLKILTMVTMLSFGITSCNAKSSETETKITKLMTPLSDSSTVKTLTITKVKKPWYAWRGIVVGKMKESIPEYQAIKGLNQKFYSFTENRKRFGGLYFWETEQDANNWFNQAWFDRIEKKYGEKGVVEYYKIQQIKTIATVNSDAKNLYATITHTKEDTFFVDSSAKGLIKILALTDDKNQTCYLTIWQNKEQAKTYFRKKNVTNEFFDVPLFIVNKK
jgi:heme-degrading monooxygenase HmoA